MENGTLNLETQKTEMAKHKPEFVEYSRSDGTKLAQLSYGQRNGNLQLDKEILYIGESRVFGFIYVYIFMLPTANVMQYQWQMNTCVGNNW